MPKLPKLLSKRQQQQLLKALHKKGFFLWAGLIDKYYPDDPEERDNAHHLWNTMPKEVQPRGWKPL